MTHGTREPVTRDAAAGDAGETAEFLAVRPARHKWGNGGQRHHARLDRTGFPACPAVDDPRHRGRFPRHGHVGRSVVRLPVGAPQGSIWRAPMP